MMRVFEGIDHRGSREVKVFLIEEFYRRLEEAKAGRKSAQQIVDETYEAYPGFAKRWMVKRNVEHILGQQP